MKAKKKPKRRKHWTATSFLFKKPRELCSRGLAAREWARKQPSYRAAWNRCEVASWMADALHRSEVLPHGYYRGKCRLCKLAMRGVEAIRKKFPDPPQPVKRGKS
jgi:hypothetical protein